MYKRRLITSFRNLSSSRLPSKAVAPSRSSLALLTAPLLASPAAAARLSTTTTTTPHLPPPTQCTIRGRLSPSEEETRMASDEDYMSFLDKANQDASDGEALAKKQNSSSKAMFKTTDEGAQVPKVIRDACQDAVYVTDADEPFEQVSLKWSGGHGLPNEAEFAKLIHHPDADSAEIAMLDPADWDARGQYTKVIDAVREAAKGGDVRVYRVARDRTRAEYWVVSSAEGRIVGAKALGVES